MIKNITIVIPTYNRIALTNNAIDSIFCNIPDQVNIAVIDDCGEEKFIYPKQMNKYGIAVENLRSKKNSGPGVCRKIGVDHSSAQLIAFLDSDDSLEIGWPDAIITATKNMNAIDKDALFIVGKPLGAARIYNYIWEILFSMPSFVRLIFARILILLFNPFYTPAIVLSRKICAFSDNLRYCEDYYTNVFALFRAKNLILISDMPCRLGRAPGSVGGLSGARWKMFKGEMSVRYTLLTSKEIPIYYRIFSPIGMLYQLTRSFLKYIIIFLKYRKI